MTNPSPLEKQLFHLEMSKGINEAARPETADAATTLTRVENLVQSQTGAFVKRKGTYQFAAVPASKYAAKMLRLRDGLGVLATDGEVYQYQESTGELRARGAGSEFTVKTTSVASSAGHETPRVYSSASSDAFHTVLYEGGSAPSTSGSTALLSIYDRESGAQVATYDIQSAFGVSGIYTARHTIVDDRYLHLWATTGAGGGTLYTCVIDLLSTLPTSYGSLTFGSVALGLYNGEILDYCHGPSYSYVAIGNGDAYPAVYAWRMDNSATVSAKVLLADNVGAICHTVRNDRLWFMGKTSIGYLTGFAVDVSTTHGFIGFPDPGSTGNQMAMVADEDGFVTAAWETTTTISGTNTCTTVNVAVSKVADVATSFVTAHVKLDRWRIGSSPFIGTAGVTKRTYMHLVKEQNAPSDDGYVATTHVIAQVDEAGYRYNSKASSNYYSVRVAAGLEPMLGLRNAKLKVQSDSTLRKVSILVPVLTTARAVGYTVAECTITNNLAKVTCQQFGGTNYVSGGCHTVYAGETPCEVGFADIPHVVTEVGAFGAGLLGAGLYRYIAVFRYVDDNGAVSWSRTSPIASATNTVVNNCTRVYIVPPCVTSHGEESPGAVTPLVTVELYRTLVGGTQYYLCGSTSPSALGVSWRPTQGADILNRMWVITDLMSDAVLATQAQLFRQPGTPNSAVDRYPPPPGNILIQHKDRLFTTDPAGARVYYSSFFVDGENAWYNPAFNLFVHGGAGPITGLASMDGRLFVFKRDAVFIIDGDGPGEGGVTGNEYSPPQRLATEHGCVDARTIVVTSEGLIYRSPRGVELLTRSLQVKYIGERVQNTVDSHKVNNGAVVATDGTLHMLVSDASNNHVELVYDFTTDCWTTSVHLAATKFTDLCLADLPIVGEVLCYGRSNDSYIIRQATNYLDDNTYYVPWTIETGWVKTGQQARARFTKILALLKANAGSEHRIIFSVAFQYVDSYAQNASWDAPYLQALAAGSQIEELEVQLNRQEVLAVRFLMSDAEPSDPTSYPIGDGRGPDVLGITFEIATKLGAPKVAAGQKA